MKKLKTIALLLIFVQMSLMARSYFNKEFAIFYYNVSISRDFRREIKGLESYINSIPGYNKKGQEKLLGRIYELTYTYLEEKLEKQYEMNILPINSFTNNVEYNEYLFPVTQIQRARKYGNSNYYLKINIDIETAIPKDARVSVLFRNKTHPMVTVSIEIYDNESMFAVKKVTGQAQSSMPIRVEEKFLYGIIAPVNLDEIDNLDENLFVLLITAMNKAINEI
jgi:hypothetical protein